ncbi:MAG: hypothetical protein ILP16_05440 [Spirochaetales bacterium]|nr:hypothetical protein [Spirochaetales bacterium]
MFFTFAADLNIKAYYHPNNMGTKYITVDILEADGSGEFTKKVYQTATINHSQTGEEGQSNAKTVFVVKITGNFTGKVTLKFTTSPLQAEYQGMFYIPEHRFSLYKGNDIIRIAEFNTGKGPAAGDYQYPNKILPVVSNNGKLKNISVTSTDAKPVWTLEYPVKLTIVESSKSSGEYDYYSNITLEVEAEATE